MPYAFDIFFSYKRNRLTRAWHEEVKERVCFYVRNELSLSENEFNVFFDTETIEAGDIFGDDIRDALKRSKCLVAIWSPDYFTSNWCLSEFHSFIERQKTRTNKLIIPASYHDGEHFPDLAKQIQFKNFNSYASTISAFWNTAAAVEFDKELKIFSKDIASKIRNAPNFDDNFPIVEVTEIQKKLEFKRASTN